MDVTPIESENKPNRTRRAIYVFGFSIAFAVMAFYITLTSDSALAETFVKGALGLIELIAISYLVTTTIDRSEILSKLGSSMRRESSSDKRYSSNTDMRNNRGDNVQVTRQDNYDDDLSRG
jgi:hypothetical protein